MTSKNEQKPFDEIMEKFSEQYRQLDGDPQAEAIMRSRLGISLASHNSGSTALRATVLPAQTWDHDPGHPIHQLRRSDKH